MFYIKLRPFSDAILWGVTHGPSSEKENISTN